MYRGYLIRTRRGLVILYGGFGDHEEVDRQKYDVLIGFRCYSRGRWQGRIGPRRGKRGLVWYVLSLDEQGAIPRV